MSASRSKLKDEFLLIKEFKVSRQTLKSACNFDIICKGYKWKLK